MLSAQHGAPVERSDAARQRVPSEPPGPTPPGDLLTSRKARVIRRQVDSRGDLRIAPSSSNPTGPPASAKILVESLLGWAGGARVRERRWLKATSHPREVEGREGEGAVRGCLWEEAGAEGVKKRFSRAGAIAELKAAEPEWAGEGE